MHTKVLNTIAAFLTANNRTIATAESCTGGYIAHLITSQSGSSIYYKGSIVAYSNEIKIRVLGVSAEIINTYGAVSKQTAENMAKGAIYVLNTDYAVAVTGIAGPNGGSGDKPVGTVWIAVASSHGEVVSKLFDFKGDRVDNIKSTADEALALLNEFMNVNSIA